MSFLKWVAVRFLIGVGTLAAVVAMIKFWTFFWRHCPAAGRVMAWVFS